MTYQKAPIVYQGNKYRLLKKIAPLFPKNINDMQFIDVFGGSSVMSLNFGKSAIYNEFNPFISKMIEFIYTRKNYLLEKFNGWVEEYKLISRCDTEQEVARFKMQYNLFREYVNSLEYGSPEHIAAIYTCHIFSINNLIRFNRDKEFNASSGHRMEIIHPVNKLKEFVLPNKKIEFFSYDFRVVLNHMIDTHTHTHQTQTHTNQLEEELFVYLDPPYLNTTAVYNENRLTGWGEQDEKELCELLDKLNDLDIKWAMSNSIVGKAGIKNEFLIQWASKYNINYFDTKYASFGNSNKNNVEVLITNYKGE